MPDACKRKGTGCNTRRRASPVKKDHETCASKRRYWSRLDALIGAEKAVGRRGGKLAVYLCPTCQGWHLTGKRFRQKIFTPTP